MTTLLLTSGTTSKPNLRSHAVLNAGNVEIDMKHFKAVLEQEFKNKDVSLEFLGDRALVAIQGPKAAGMVQKLVKEDLSKVNFMTMFATKLQHLNIDAILCRCGYTGTPGLTEARMALKSA